jgi:intracellular sulfur oxidation DsrE/DsrF family protein
MNRLNKAPGLRLALAAAALCAGLAPMAASAAGAPAITQYGKVAPVENPGQLPDPAMDYKVVISLASDAQAGGHLKGLEAAARLVNLLAEAGVPAAHRHIVVVMHGAATLGVLNEAAAQVRLKGPNPNADIIAKLQAAGVSVRVCSQALAGAKIARSEVIPSIEADYSAMTTITTLELQGYALLPM